MVLEFNGSQIHPFHSPISRMTVCAANRNQSARNFQSLFWRQLIDKKFRLCGSFYLKPLVTQLTENDRIFYGNGGTKFRKQFGTFAV
jgi:hypothetical protein